MAAAVRGKISFTSNIAETARIVAALQWTMTPVVMKAWLELYMRPWLVNRTKSRFATEGDEAVGGKWAELQPATQEVRANLGLPPAHPINIRQGALYNFVTTSWQTSMTPVGATLSMPGDAGSSKELMDKLMTAQQGSKNGRTVPRPVIALDVKDAIFATASLGNFIEQTVRHASGMSAGPMLDVS